MWQAGHGGYQVHFDKVVFAGTWTKTFTRMTSMEAASESGPPRGERDPRPLSLRHEPRRRQEICVPVTRSRGACRTDSWTRTSRVPIRLPTPAGDYCFIYDCENREPGDAAADAPARRRVLRPGSPASVDDLRHGPGRGRGVRTPTRSTTSPTTCRRSCSSCGSGGVSSRRCSRPHRAPSECAGIEARPAPIARERSGCTAHRRPPRRRRRVHRRRFTTAGDSRARDPPRASRVKPAEADRRRLRPEREVRAERGYLWSRVTTPSHPSGTPRSRRWRARAR